SFTPSPVPALSRYDHHSRFSKDVKILFCFQEIRAARATLRPPVSAALWPRSTRTSSAMTEARGRSPSEPAHASAFSVLYDRKRRAPLSPDSDSASAVATMRAWSGDLWQAGSALRASPVRASAWQRQPPQSISRRSQERQGSRIQSVPRKALKAGFECQISASEWSRTLQNSSPGIDSAAWQGSALPDGETLIATRPHPPAQGF